MNTKLRARKFRIRRAQPLIIEGQAVAAAPVVADLTRTAPVSRVAGQAPGRAAVATPPAPLYVDDARFLKQERNFGYRMALDRLGEQADAG